MGAEITLIVNGAPVRFDGDPLTRLLDFLRTGLGLTGAKEGCGEGECGACTVWLDGEAVCACLVPMLQVEGREVRTVEGLAQGRLTALQRAFVAEGAVQCGACTPGMIMSAEALLVRRPRPTELEIRTHLAGNICRCTGYQAIVRAVQRAAKPQPARSGRGATEAAGADGGAAKHAGTKAAAPKPVAKRRPGVGTAPARRPGTKATATKTRATSASATKASAVKTRATSASATKASAVKTRTTSASATKASAVKTRATSASASRASAVTATSAGAAGSKAARAAGTRATAAGQTPKRPAPPPQRRRVKPRGTRR